ncbi:hypothetical protein [Absidia glauca]|uniref:Zn(2)-C6 fungal-type domain-containing protein n=1 Tax=Absidia glauca TaxID=4829 RepID=A0A163J1A8_ABSGL|nr:hypothetical protein [Absidia glauca]
MQPIDNSNSLSLETQLYASDGQPLPLPIMNSDNKTTISASRKAKTSKRKQVKNACTNCRKACKKCDEGRACQRCVKLGIADTCIDSPRTDRSKGAKRGPYKKRQQQQKEKRGDSPNPNLVFLNTVTDGINQTDTDSNTASLPYEQTVAWDTTPALGYQQVSPYQQQDLVRPRQSSLSSLDMMPLSYYSPPITLNSYQGTSSPLTVDQYASPSVSTSPASSSTLLLPQDTLHSVFMVEGQEPIYPANQMMMMVPLQDPYDFPPPPPPPSQPAQPFYYHQPYYHLPQQKPQLYWDPVYDPRPYL